jgi:hypothetical protein
VPFHLGPLLEITDDLIHQIQINEEGASYLHGTIFYDDDLEWCKITGWGVECGTTLVYYSPVSAKDPTTDEHHSSLADVLSWIRNSPLAPVRTGYKPSRTLKRSMRTEGKCLLTRILACAPIIPCLGSMTIRPGPRIPITSNLLMAKTIRKILKAQESLFKYGTFIPRNDTEAEKSPEAHRWKSGRQLEWLRLEAAKTFETHWTWEKIQEQFPGYKR